MDDPFTFIVAAAVIVAATLQAATGIGFGLIGGPALLTAVPAPTALVTCGLLSLGIALGLIPKVFRHVAWADLGRLCIGGLAGLPVGVVIYIHADVTAVKIAAAATVGFALFGLVVPVVAGRQPSPRTGYAIGAVSAVLGVAVSMPGPLAAAYLLREGHAKAAVRATILAFFVPAYLAILALQVWFAGPPGIDWRITFWLAPVVVAGMLIGNILSRRLSERSFRLALQVVLAATIASLAVSTVAGARP